MSAGPERTEPAAPAHSATPPEPPVTPAPSPQEPPAPVGPSMAAFGGNETCPNCSARMAPDQRYCLNCGHRRGDPRLPFMDAVVFMESMNAPAGGAGATPPPPPAKSGGDNRWNANAALIAGVATLVLAIGVGFLIGRSGHDNTAAAPAGKVQVVQVGGGAPAGEEAAAPTPGEEEATSGEKSGKSASGKKSGKSSGKSPSKKKASEVKEGSQEELKRGEEKANEVLHSTVPAVKAGTQLGETCEPGVAGCSDNGKFEGNFFGE